MLRAAEISDREGIAALWRQAFGDTEQAVMGFFAAFPNCRSYMAEENGKIVSMVHALPQTLSPDLPAAYLYAVATDKAYRGKGLCRRLMAFAEKDLKANGFAACVLTPGEPSLFRFYENSGYETAFFRRRTPFSGGRPISAADYGRRRETLVAAPHMVYDENTLLYAQSLYGLTFYETDTGIAAAGDGYTAECLPEDLGGEPFAMVKWLTTAKAISPAYLGISLE